jgi:hypothetical protein
VLRIKIVHGNDTGEIHEYEDPAAQSLLDAGYAVLAPLEEGPPPEVTSLEPTGAICGGPDLTLHVLGTGFTEASVILFNGGEEVTVYVSPTELTTIVKPSLAPLAVVVPVSVVGALTAVDFAFTAPSGGTFGASSKAKG